MKCKLWLIISSFSVIVSMILIYSLFYTEPGLNWLIKISSQNISGKLSYQSISGNLTSEIEIDRLYYQNSDFEIDIKRGKLRWQPWKLTGGLLHINTIELDGVNIRTQSPVATSAAFELPHITFPISFLLQDVTLNNFKHYIDGNESLHLNDLQLSAKLRSESIIISGLLAESDDYTLALNGELKTQGNYPVDVSGSFQMKELFAQPFNVKADLTGNLLKLQITANVAGFINGKVKGAIFDVVNKPHWNAIASVTTLKLESFSADLPTHNITGEFESSGSIDNFKLIGKAATHYPEWGDIILKYDAAIVGNELIIHDLHLQEKNHLTAISSQGSINWGAEEVVYNLAGRWQQMEWPWIVADVKTSDKSMHKDNDEINVAEYRSPSGNVTFNGKVSNYVLALEADIEGSEIPPLHVSTDTSGDFEKLQINEMRVDTLDGNITATGELEWQKYFRWRADLNLKNINPAFFLQDVSGQINTNILTNGHISGTSYSAGITAQDISGKLQNKLLSGSAEVNLVNQVVDIKQFNLKLDNTELMLQGNINEQSDLQFKLMSKDLSGILPKLHGQLALSGKILGQPGEPRLVMDLNAKKLVYDKFMVGTLSTTADVSINPQHALQMNLVADDLSIDGRIINNIQLKTDGLLSQHKITMEMRQSENTLNLKAGGGMVDNTWRGDIFDSEIKMETIGNWRLRQSSGLTFGEKFIKMEKNCYSQQLANFCFDAEYKNSKLTTDLDWQNLAVEKFRHWLAPELKISSMVSGSAHLTYEDEQLSASANTHNTPGDITVAVDAGEQQVKFGAGKMTFVWNPQQIKATFLLPLEDKARLDARIFISPSNWPLQVRQRPLKGNVILQLPTLVFFEPFIPELKNLKQAHAEVKLHISGNLQQPIIIGNANVQATELQAPDLNVTLNNVELNVKVNEKNLINFSGAASAGEGKVKFEGETKYTPEKKWKGYAKIQGENFLVVDIPAATVQITPKLSVDLNKNILLVEGDIKVPYARLRPRKLPTGTMTESADLVIADTNVDKTTGSARWEIVSKIRLVLGERVSFVGFGLRSKLTGSLQLYDNPGEVTVGRGEINLLDGYYRSFGQELQISKGRFLFANTPIDDPGLDIRAQRAIGEITAGIKVTSTLRKPEVNLFSEPLMSESDTLSYVLLGRPIRQVNQNEGSQLMTAATAMGLAGGELMARSIGNRLGIEEVQIQTDTDAGTSSLVIGRYLSPKLYIRYFTGIFERSNIVQLRYNVSNKVILQTITGSQMGADVFYTIEH